MPQRGTLCQFGGVFGATLEVGQGGLLCFGPEMVDRVVRIVGMGLVAMPIRSAYYGAGHNGSPDT